MMIRVTQPTSLGVPMVVAHWLRDIADIMSHTFVSISVKLIIIDNRRGKRRAVFSNISKASKRKFNIDLNNAKAGAN